MQYIGACSCRKGVQRDNCPNCEGTGKAIDWRAFHATSRAKESAPPRYVTDAEAERIMRAWPIDSGNPDADLSNRIAETYSRLLVTRAALLEIVRYAMPRVPGCSDQNCFACKERKKYEALLAQIRGEK